MSGPMVTVRRPDGLRRYAGDAARVEVEALSAAGALAAVAANHPDLATRLFNAAGALRSHLSVVVDGKVVGHDGLDTTPVEPGQEVVLLVAVAGG